MVFGIFEVNLSLKRKGLFLFFFSSLSAEAFHIINYVAKKYLHFNESSNTI
jgi:hypothetical protein